MRLFAALLTALLAWTPLAAADHVIGERSDWDEAHARIYTTKIVQRDDGRFEVRKSLGGTVDGIRMVQFPLLSPGIAPWVPALSEGGNRLRWAKSCVFMSMHSGGSNDILGDMEFDVLTEILAHWEANTSQCSYLSFRPEMPVSNEPGYDGVNVVKFREEADGWPSEYGPGAAGITTIFHVDKPGAEDDGTILDTDVELNSVDFAIALDCQTNGVGKIADLRNTLTHEIGHVMGLDHTCWDKAGPNPTDGDGATVPSCFPQSSLTTEILEATMYTFQDEKETKKATIEADDVEGICELYPVASDPASCEPAVEDPGGCLTVAGRGRPRSGGGGWLTLAVLLSLAPLARRAEARKRRG